ncbi:SubName: Full=Related to CIPB-Lentinula edodes {ECO:0000313/EMBL:CCA75120.1} [Serendipita indica DSM 11827]|nr:SubName: Full=Related to CIPB-Lentinula edodes {ECO:0000313/EMBL:CCA75120.1} [Serendipita indica DSM 11827]
MRLLVQSVSSLTVRTGRVQAQRCIATSSALRKDLVQDMYLKELKAYKPAPKVHCSSTFLRRTKMLKHDLLSNEKAKDAHVGAVREFKAPAVPEAPSLPGDVAAELSAYDASEPTLAPKSGAPAATSTTEGHGKADGKLTGPALLKFLEQDLPKEEHHHH